MLFNKIKKVLEIAILLILSEHFWLESQLLNKKISNTMLALCTSLDLVISQTTKPVRSLCRRIVSPARRYAYGPIYSASNRLAMRFWQLSRGLLTQTPVWSAKRSSSKRVRVPCPSHNVFIGFHLLCTFFTTYKSTSFNSLASGDFDTVLAIKAMVKTDNLDYEPQNSIHPYFRGNATVCFKREGIQDCRSKTGAFLLCANMRWHAETTFDDISVFPPSVTL